MTYFNLRSVSIVIAGLVITAQSTHATQPPDVVNSDSYSNTASGTNALLNVQGGSGGTLNSAFGANALQYNTTGYDNTAVGNAALQMNTTGYWNTAIGDGALGANTTGFANTATGTSSLVANTTGTGNTATGINSLFSNTSGSANTAVVLAPAISSRRGRCAAIAPVTNHVAANTRQGSPSRRARSGRS